MSSEASCRNCQSNSTVVSLRGEIAPFFALRVSGEGLPESLAEAMERRASASPAGIRRTLILVALALLGRIKRTKRILDFRSARMTRIRACGDCGFVGPDYAYPFGQLVGLYRDYRSDSYNRDRCRLEPWYREVMHRVGRDPIEVESRREHIDSLIDGFLCVDAMSTVLDWGGGEGRFIPTSLRGKSVTILDVSDEPLCSDRYSRVSALPAGSKFDYMQICHVLEHVSEPFALMKEVLGHVHDGGAVYIEVPQDRSDAEMLGLVNGPGGTRHVIHEHLNLFGVKSIERLGRALGLKQLHVAARVLDLGWTKATVISGVFIKVPQRADQGDAPPLAGGLSSEDDRHAHPPR